MTAGMNFQTVDPNQQFAGGEVIPHGTLAFGVIKIKPFNFDNGVIATTSKQPGQNGVFGKYLDVEVTITEGQHARRKVFDRIGVAGSEKWQAAGFAAIRHILETGRGASDTNQAAYVIGAGSAAGSDTGFMELDGLKVAVRIGVEPARLKVEGNPAGGEWPAKNVIQAYLSPNPASDTAKDYARLVAGDTAPKVTAPVPTGLVKPATAAPAWGGAAAVAPIQGSAQPPSAAVVAQQKPWGAPAWGQPAG